MKTFYFILIALLAIFVSSCLTVEKKEYKFEFTGKNTGKLTITYVNIFSQIDDSTDVSEQDFDELINTYIIGEKIENTFPLATNITKRLYEQNGVLNGEVTMEFSSLDAVRLYQFNSKSPITFSMAQTVDSETYGSSNGILANPDYMNVIFWKPKTKVLQVCTMINEFVEGECYSLLEQYRNNKKN